MVVNFNQLLVDQKSGPRFNIVGFRIILVILKRGRKIVAIQKYKIGQKDLSAEESGSIEVIVPFINLKPKRPEASCVSANAQS